MIVLEANHIEKTIKDRKLLDIKQIQIRYKDRIGVVGRNGSGKTTLLSILSGETEADKGEVKTNASRYFLPQLKETDTFKSGGEVTKSYIDKALATKAEILFVDEPTTNLDARAIEELEKHFIRYRGAIILVSHNRYFLDQVCTKILELEDGKIKEYIGNYTSYVEQKEMLRRKQQEEYEKYIAKKRQLERAKKLKEQKAQRMIKPPSKRMGTSESRIWKMEHATKQKKMHQNIKALETRAEKLEHVEKPKELPPIKMNLLNCEQIQGRHMISVKNASVNFDNHLLWKDAFFVIKGGEKVAIIGNNGVGKTTMLKQILERVPAVTISPVAKIGYFSQNLDILDSQESILENVMSTSIQDETTVRTVLARLHFYRDDVYKEVNVLSGGERVKVAFAKLFVSDCNTLILDEPTNYLDIDAVEALEDLLINYKGAVIFVSHDSRFVGNIATKIIEISQQKVTGFTGSYKEFKERNQQTERDNIKDELLKVEVKLTQIISELNGESSDKLEQEFQMLINKRNSLRNQLNKKRGGLV
ncbi:Vga family ABC-F type ribosomal protection protein [Bacillus aquiflavi]|uniref:Vga family ABC-F type ribosomal protection protein n=1 Tax=Bacillus aquiflavi TaxID=2672567 RepID=UPI001CA96D48|nr:Vga family ABC-F type ribosomal protection protein [Bacillus aquiflavi]UAC49882.1 Vga family ABC-F type ribosomal protection protein [Bacillus aquiflavi]